MKSLPLAPMSLRPLPHSSDALSGDTRRSAFAPFALVWIAPCDIRIILLASKINQRELAPAGNPSLKLEVIFCVRGVISVLLSNLYLHHVLDLWFERQVKPRLRGEAHLVRYIDDFVICFQYRDDADRVQAVLSKWLNKFALALEPSKTKLIKFGRFAQREAHVQRERPETFSFLGFTHYGTRNRKGNYTVGRKTAQPSPPRPLRLLWDRRQRAIPPQGLLPCGTVLAQDAL